MSEYELRLKVLQMAQDFGQWHHGTTPEEIVAIAANYFAFIKGETPPLLDAPSPEYIRGFEALHAALKAAANPR